jgi:hypothetical protein
MGRFEGMGDGCQATEAENRHGFSSPEPRTDR